MQTITLLLNLGINERFQCENETPRDTSGRNSKVALALTYWRYVQPKTELFLEELS